jgi:predicted ArsR family transcriptional regulator
MEETLELIENDGKTTNELQGELIKTLEKNGAMTRAQMVQALEKPRTTVYDNLAVLIERGVVKKFSRQVNVRGRPVVFFKLKEE